MKWVGTLEMQAELVGLRSLMYGSQSFTLQKHERITSSTQDSVTAGQGEEEGQDSVKRVVLACLQPASD